jgi:hypothetical protein
VTVTNCLPCKLSRTSGRQPLDFLLSVDWLDERVALSSTAFTPTFNSFNSVQQSMVEN